MPTPEQLARQNIDALLAQCGWIVQSRSDMNLGAGRGIAVREFPLKTGFADYLLFVDSAARLCVMNLYLHGIGTNGGDSPIRVGDSLAADPGQRFEMVLTNPPFGKKSSVTFVVPDNVLFEGGAGETIRRKLLHECDVHTLLRLPTGIFYAQGVKANVLFFDRKPASETPWTKTLWIYDLRTNINFTLKQNPLARADLDDFVTCYQPENRHQRAATWSSDNPIGRWRAFTYDELLARDKVNLDIFWLRDESLEDTANLPNPDILAGEIIEDLQAALEQFTAIAEEVGE